MVHCQQQRCQHILSYTHGLLEREHDARSKFTALQIQMKLVSDYGQLLKEDEVSIIIQAGLSGCVLVWKGPSQKQTNLNKCNQPKKETNVSETSPLLRQHHPDNLHDNDTTWSPFLDKKHHQLDYQVPLH